MSAPEFVEHTFKVHVYTWGEPEHGPTRSITAFGENCEVGVRACRVILVSLSRGGRDCAENRGNARAHSVPVRSSLSSVLRFCFSLPFFFSGPPFPPLRCSLSVFFFPLLPFFPPDSQIPLSLKLKYILKQRVQRKVHGASVPTKFFFPYGRIFATHQYLSNAYKTRRPAGVPPLSPKGDNCY